MQFVVYVGILVPKVKHITSAFSQQFAQLHTIKEN